MSYYLASFDEPIGTVNYHAIIQADSSPFQKVVLVNGRMARCHSCSAPAPDEATLRRDSKIPDYLCVKCNSPHSLCFYGKEKLIERRMCFQCSFWQDLIGRKDDPNVARINGEHYVVNKATAEGRDAQFNGYGGSKFTIKWNDGREVTTNDLWNQGRIPDRFRDELPDNAEFVRTKGSKQ